MRHPSSTCQKKTLWGLIAQDVEKINPVLVDDVVQGEGSKYESIKSCHDMIVLEGSITKGDQFIF